MKPEVWISGHIDLNSIPNFPIDNNWKIEDNKLIRVSQFFNNENIIKFIKKMSPFIEIGDRDLISIIIEVRFERVYQEIEFFIGDNFFEVQVLIKSYFPKIGYN